MPRGRKPKLTPEVQDAFVQAISVGATYELASAYAGISRSTLDRWMKKAENDPASKYHAFRLAVRSAEGKAAAGCLALIRSAAKESWQAAAWLLERRFPDEYGRQRVDLRASGKLEHSHSGAVGLDVSKLSVEELKSLDALLAKLAEEAGSQSGGGADDPAGGTRTTEPA